MCIRCSCQPITFCRIRFLIPTDYLLECQREERTAATTTTTAANIGQQEQQEQQQQLPQQQQQPAAPAAATRTASIGEQEQQQQQATAAGKAIASIGGRESPGLFFFHMSSNSRAKSAPCLPFYMVAGFHSTSICQEKSSSGLPVTAPRLLAGRFPAP